MFNPVVNQRSRLRGRPLGANPDATCVVACPRNLYYRIATGYLCQPPFCFRLTVVRLRFIADCDRLAQPLFTSPRERQRLLTLQPPPGPNRVRSADSTILPPSHSARQSLSAIDLLRSLPALLLQPRFPRPPGYSNLSSSAYSRTPHPPPSASEPAFFDAQPDYHPPLAPVKLFVSIFSFAAFALRSEAETLAGRQSSLTWKIVKQIASHLMRWRKPAKFR